MIQKVFGILVVGSAAYLTITAIQLITHLVEQNKRNKRIEQLDALMIEVCKPDLTVEEAFIILDKLELIKKSI